MSAIMTSETAKTAGEIGDDWKVVAVQKFTKSMFWEWEMPFEEQEILKLMLKDHVVIMVQRREANQTVLLMKKTKRRAGRN